MYTKKTYSIILATFCCATFFFSSENAPAQSEEKFTLVFDFESGNLAEEGWVIVEGSNSRPIGERATEFHNNTVPYQKRGRRYLTTLELAGNPNPSDDPKCVIESPVFRIEGKTAKLLLGGGKRAQTYVALCVLSENGESKETHKAFGDENQGLQEHVWNVTDFIGQDAFFKLVDLETGPWAHIRADHFRIDATVNPEKTAQRRKALLEEKLELRREELRAELAIFEKMLEEVLHHYTELRDEFSPETHGMIREVMRVIEKRIAALQLLGIEENSSEIRILIDDLKGGIHRIHPLVNSHPILYVTRPQYLPDHHNTATLFQTGEINTGSFRGGGSLKLWFPKSRKTATILVVPVGIVRDPCLSFDAKKVLLSIRRNIEDDYHIYELRLDEDLIEGRKVDPLFVKPNSTPDELPGLTQLTFGQGLADIDPIYLPDGKILFSSTREPKYCMCNRHIMCNLYTMNADGSNLLQIGHSTLFEGHPSLLNDGRVIYDRWEYVDRNFGDAQGVWVANPDGTNHAIYWGNSTASPGGVIDARTLPQGITETDNDSLFICTFSSCHDRPWGAIALVDRRLGLDGKTPVLQTWPAEARELVEKGNYDTFISLKQKFEDPFPISDTLFLASGTLGRGEETGIWLLDRYGNSTLLFEDAPGCYDPIPLRPTTPPPALASKVDLSQKTGHFYVADVYRGYGMEKIPRGSVKFLRIIESPEKRTWTHTAWDNGTGTQAPGMSWFDFNNKRILGTVDVESDGSAYFSVPADRFVYFQLLDENGMMIQTMRSGTMVRPGEQAGCVGCHENRLESSPSQLHNGGLAMRKKPQTPRPWHGQERLFSYLHEVQPVFDRYCMDCHDYDGKGAKTLVLAGDRNLLFNASYRELYSKNYVRTVGAGPHEKLPPLTWGARRSKLVEVLLHGHKDESIERERKEKNLVLNRETDAESFDRIVTWIDLNGPYYPSYGSSYRENRFGRSPLNHEQEKRLRELFGEDPLWSVSFDRPEKSPILKKWPENSSEYDEALKILQQGKANLKARARGEEPEFQSLDPVEIRQEKKYESFRLKEAARIDAAAKNEILFEK